MSSTSLAALAFPNQCPGQQVTGQQVTAPALNETGAQDYFCDLVTPKIVLSSSRWAFL